MAASQVQDLLAKNEIYASSGFVAPPSLAAIQSSPIKGNVTAIVTCADPRVVPEHIFGFGRDEMPSIRVSGGRARNALRSLLIVNKALGIGRVVVLHHTNCGALEVSQAEHEAHYKRKAPQNSKDVDAVGFDCITDLDQSVKSDVEWLKGLPYWEEGFVVVGMVYDTFTGRVRVVE